MTLNKSYRKDKDNRFMQVLIGMFAVYAMIEIATMGYNFGQLLKNYW